ncbi:MAG: bacterio-opsin activator domain-containing protein [Haloarculaceae archaeon]
MTTPPATEGATVELTERTYRALRRATESYREDLVLRLGAEAGLRPAEMARLRLSDVESFVARGREHYFAIVDSDEADAERRTAYLPPAVEHDLRRYATTAGVADGERFFSVTPRRLQMLVSEVADRAADRTGIDELGSVSSRTLRRYFARRLLVEEGVDPAVVRAVGGWRRLASLEPYVLEPDRDVIADAFADTSLWAGLGDRLDAEAVARVVDEAALPLVVTDADDVIAYANERFGSVTGTEAGEAVGRPLDRFVADGEWRSPRGRAGDDPTVAAVTLVGADGDGWPARCRVARVDGADGRGRSLVVFDGAGDATAPLRDGTTRLDGVLDRIAAVRDALATASTREEICRVVARELTDADAYRAAWVAEVTGDGLDVLAAADGDADASPPTAVGGAVATVVETGATRSTRDVSSGGEFADWRAHADAAGYRAAAVVPIGDDGAVEAVLGVGAATVGEREPALLAELGAHVGQALTAAEQRKLLLADTTLELTFESDDETAVFAAASRAHDCRVALDGVVPGERGTLLYFVRVADARPEPVIEWATDCEAVADARLLRDRGEEALLELGITGPDPSHCLAHSGATIRDLVAADGTERIVCDVSADADVRALVDDLKTSFPDTELRTKRERERPPEPEPSVRDALRESLTDKQAAVLQAAFHAGYFEWPRGSTAEELADSMGVTSPTLHNHLRRAQQKLLSAFYGDGESRRTADAWPGDDGR